MNPPGARALRLGIVLVAIGLALVVTSWGDTYTFAVFRPASDTSSPLLVLGVKATLGLASVGAGLVSLAAGLGYRRGLAAQDPGARGQTLPD